MKRQDIALAPAPPSAESLKHIVERIHSPEQLDSHPLARSQIVEDAMRRQPALRSLPPGRRLIAAVAEAFEGMMPSLPPRRGLRLDTQWGEFGILAARYFAPLKFGVATPASLRDAWGRIDEAILLFVYGSAHGSRPADDMARYRLVGNEREVAPDSTLSDWHRNGLKRLAKTIGEREAHLDVAAGLQAKPAGARGEKRRRPPLTKAAAMGLVLGLALLLAALAGWKAYRIYHLAQVTRADMQRVQTALSSTTDTEGLLRAAGQLPQLDDDLTGLQAELQPVQRLAPMLSWVPVYGGDIAQSGDLLELGHQLIRCAEKAETGLSPLLVTAPDKTNLSLTSIAGILTKARPQLMDAESSFQAAQAARSRLDTAQLSPTVRELITKRLDPGMAWIGDGLALGVAFPTLMGAGPEGPQTYLLVAQNEDELRATGGFITSVGKLLLDQGRVVDLSFENSGDLDNWSMPYPMAPWQLRQYMNSSVLVLRDANWFPDFPTAALYVKQMYAYNHQDSVDGVIAFDQQMLILLLRELGPVKVDGVPYALTADNVTAYMYQAKTPPANQPLPPGWTYKGFVGTLAKAVLSKILAGDAPEWRSLAAALLEGLQQRHLLLQIDDRDIAGVLARRGWSGMVSSQGGDFLMILDSNVGFNKTNAVVETGISYDIDLENPSSPTGTLLISHTNHAAGNPSCTQWSDENQLPPDYYYPINRCYWDYVRVYVPRGTLLLDSTPQNIPDSWTLLDQPVPPRVDILDEGLPGLSSFGTLLVVSGGNTVTTELKFELPSSTVLTPNAEGGFTYRLNVRKQPGTVAVPITIRIHLPAGYRVESPAPGWVLDGRNILINTDLRMDVRLQVLFRRP